MTMLSDNLFCDFNLACFEGGDADADADAAAAAAAAAAAKSKSVEKSFSQADLNKFLAEDRRLHQEKYKKLESSYESILADKGLASDSRQELETELESLRANYRTEKQQIEADKATQKEKYEAELTEFKASSAKYEELYTDTVINQSLQDAAVRGEAFNSEQIAGLLRPLTSLRDLTDEDGKPTGVIAPMTEFPDVDAKTGEPIKTLRTPQDAVRRMKELPEQYGNLFRANVVSGVGQGAATGGAAPGKGGNVDVAKLSSEQYRKIRKENPELLGLRSRS